MTEAVIIQKPVHWFALQINGLVANQWIGFYMITVPVMKGLNIILLCSLESKYYTQNYYTVISSPQGDFVAPDLWEMVGRKNLTIFKGCHCSRFYIMISSSFRKIVTENLNSDPRILIFLVLQTASPAAH